MPRINGNLSVAGTGSVGKTIRIDKVGGKKSTSTLTVAALNVASLCEDQVKNWCCTWSLTVAALYFF